MNHENDILDPPYNMEEDPTEEFHTSDADAHAHADIDDFDDEEETDYEH